MLDDRGHLRAMRLLPFAAAADKAYLTLKRQVTISFRCLEAEVQKPQSNA